MTTQIDIKKLLSKGLTGKEAGKLVIQDSWQVDRGEEGFLSDRDIRVIKFSLKTNKDIDDYNALIETYRLMDYTLKEARIKALEAHIKINALQSLIRWYLLDSGSQKELRLRPVVMTEKEYQERKAKQRERFLQDTHCLGYVIEERARELDPDKDEEWQETVEEEDFLDFLADKAPELRMRVISEVLELLKSGQLQPVALSRKTIQKLKELDQKSDQARAELPINKLSMEELQELALAGKHAPRNKEAEEGLDRLLEEHTKTIERAYKTGRRSLSQQKQDTLVNMLEQLLEGSLNKEDEELLLDYTFCSGDELYKTGLPEWIQWIETYKPGLYEEGGGDLGGVAILVDPSPHLVDERGYYKGYRRIYNIQETSDKLKISETFSIGRRLINGYVKIVLGFLSITEAISKAIGIDFIADVKVWQKDIEDQALAYNRDIERALHDPFVPEDIKDALKPLDIEQLKPSAKTVNYLRERLALSLGEDWWKDVKKALVDDLKEKEAQGV